MLSLSPAKLLVLLVIALIVLGPEKLPQVARQMGAAWHDLRRLRSRLENEVRSTFPDMPPAHEVAQAVRSPLAFLDRLADEHARTLSAEDPSGDEQAGGAGTPDPGTAESGAGPPGIGAGTNGTMGQGVAGHGLAANGAAGNGSSAVAPTAQWGSGAPAADPPVADDPAMN